MKVIKFARSSINGLPTEVITVASARGPVALDGHQFRVGELPISRREMLRRVAAAPYNRSYRASSGGGAFEQTLVC